MNPNAPPATLHETFSQGDSHMLVLTRKKHEQLMIKLGNESVIVRIVDIGHNRVRLGVIAPRHVAVHRDEVAQRIAQEEKELADAHAGAIAS